MERLKFCGFNIDDVDKVQTRLGLEIVGVGT